MIADPLVATPDGTHLVGQKGRRASPERRLVVIDRRTKSDGYAWMEPTVTSG
jgi:hypothetical protein